MRLGVSVTGGRFTTFCQGCRTGLHVHCTCSCGVNSLYYWTCSENFFLSLSVPLSPLVSHSLPEAKTIFFPFKKKTGKKTHVKITSKTRRGKPRNVLVRRGEGYQTGAALARGLPYSSRRYGDQRSLEKYAHGRESQAEGWHKNLPVLWFEPLLQARPLPGPPGGGKRFEKGALDLLDWTTLFF